MKKIIIISCLLCFSCVRTYVVPEQSINNKLKNEKLSQGGRISLYSILTLPAGVIVMTTSPDFESFNELKWLPVLDKNGNKLEVEINRNSTFIIITKSDKKVKMLAKTAFIENGILKGSRSMIIGLPREIALDDIKSIKLYTENSKRRNYNK